MYTNLKFCIFLLDIFQNNNFYKTKESVWVVAEGCLNLFIIIFPWLDNANKILT